MVNASEVPIEQDQNATEGMSVMVQLESGNESTLELENDAKTIFGGPPKHDDGQNTRY